jgi:hypothetical protein
MDAEYQPERLQGEEGLPNTPRRQEVGALIAGRDDPLRDAQYRCGQLLEL